MSFYFLAWVASLLYGLEVIFGKLASKYLIQNPWLFNFIWNLAVLAGLTLISLNQEISFPFAWGNLFLASLFYALGCVLYVLALYKLDVSVLTPLFNVRTVLAVILGSLVLGEVLSLSQYVLVAVVFIAGIFVSLDEKWTLRSFFSRSIAIAMADMIALAFMALFVNKAISELGFWTATLWTALLAQIMFLVTTPLFWRDAFKLKRGQVVSVSLIALAGVLATLAVNKAYAENIGITSVIISIPFSMIFAIVFSIFKPDFLEKHTTKVYIVRLIAALVMILAALKLSI